MSIRMIIAALGGSLAPADHDGPATPPKEFRVFRTGTNTSEKGDFLFDDAAAKSVMERAQRWGNRFPIDWAHGMVKPLENGSDPAEQNKAAGWFTPELRAGGLWAVDVNWTALAAGKIAAREYAYFSPAFNVDDAGRVVELTNIALTNLPAMRDLAPLVAASKTTATRRLTMSKEDLKSKIHSLHSKIHGAMYDEGMKSHIDAKLDAMSMDELKAHHDKLDKLCSAPAADGDAPPAKKPDGDEAPPAKAAAKDDGVVDSDGDGDGDMEKKDKQHSKGEGAVVLSRVVELEREIHSLRTQREADARAVVLERAVRDGKITPAEAAGNGKRGSFIKALSLDMLRSYVDTSDAKVATGEHSQPAGDAPATGEQTFKVELSKGAQPTTVTLSKLDLKLAHEFGLDAAAVAKTRALEPWNQRG